jgi:predicted Zn-dependent peptidase
MITSKELKNGMQAILVPQKGAVSTTVMVFVRVGSRYETKPINGASHFLEHLLFKGTKKRPDALMISKELDRYGAEFNAYTGKDATVYYIKMDAKHTPLAVDMLHDMLFHSLFDKTEMDKERGVIVEEINMYEDNPRMHIEDMLEEAVFPGSTLGWNIAGPRETIRTVPREAIIDYHDTYYIPSRITVVVSGKIVPGVWTLLEKTFGRVVQPKKPQDKSFTRFTPPKRLPDPIRLQTKKTEQVQLSIAFPGYPYGDEHLPAVQLLATILGGSMSSRLFTEVRERRGLCYSISASHQALEDTGVFTIASGLEKSSVKQAMEVIWKELKNVSNNHLSADELKRAKDHIRGKVSLSLEDSANQAEWYGKQWMFQKKLLNPEARLKLIDRVTAGQIKTVAKHIFQKPRMAAAIIGPFKTRGEVEQLLKID